MISALFYIFLFSSWGLGLIAFISVIGINVEKWQKEKETIDFKIKEKRVFFERLISSNSIFNPSLFSQQNKKDDLDTPAAQIAEKVRELMSHSPNHPEVAEIDGSDDIIGVRFEAENYPPGFEEDE
jgi:hypothetical protein